jgi:ADP-ribose pyrophosphatase
VRIESDERVWSGRFPLDVIRFRNRRFDGSMSALRTWELWRRGAAAALLPYDPVLDAVVLIEQFRLPALAAGLDPVLVEVPAGLCDGTETPEQTIRREMQEETGLMPERLTRIGQFLLTAGGSDELCTLFAGRISVPASAADGVLGHAGTVTEHEDIRVRVWPAATAIDAALAGRIPNSVAAIALLWLAARREALRSEWMQP